MDFSRQPRLATDIAAFVYALFAILFDRQRRAILRLSPRGCVDVRARIDADGNETIIQVHDNGIGLCGASAGSLFQPFTRLHGDDFAVHGVGLSMVRRAVERQGGRVWAESELGKSASFFFSLPNVPTAEVSALPREITEVKHAVALQAGD